MPHLSSKSEPCLNRTESAIDGLDLSKTIKRHIGHGPRLTRFCRDGLDLLAMENEWVRIVIWPGHGADLLEFRHKPSDIDVLWKNPQCWPPRKRSLDLPHCGRSEFYDTFHGGWFVSLPNGFFPADYHGAPLGCHGEMLAVSWATEVLEESPERVRLRLTGRGVRTPWMLARELEIRTGEPFVRWHEKLTNRSAKRLPAAWLHHPGFGGPLIEGAEIVTPARTVMTPPSDRSELGQLQPSYRGPWPQVPEQCGVIRDCSRVPEEGSDAEHVVHLTDFPTGWGCVWNEARQLGFGIRWDERVFPYAWSWASGRSIDTYPLWGSCHTVTIQPSTSPMLPFDRLIETDQLLWVEGMGTVETELTVGFTRYRDQVLELSADQK
jgi:galactose mutarotase-like enzyme